MSVLVILFGQTEIILKDSTAIVYVTKSEKFIKIENQQNWIMFKSRNIYKKYEQPFDIFFYFFITGEMCKGRRPV